jgi:hypothetical protein
LSYADAYSHLGHEVAEVYMHKRRVNALGYLTPVEFEAQWLSPQPLPDTVIQYHCPFFSPKTGVATPRISPKLICVMNIMARLATSLIQSPV